MESITAAIALRHARDRGLDGGLLFLHDGEHRAELVVVVHHASLESSQA
jgi:hypothetical protein